MDWEEEHQTFSLKMENNDSTMPPWLWRHSHVSFLLLPSPNTLSNMNPHIFIHCKKLNVKKPQREILFKSFFALD